MHTLYFYELIKIEQRQALERAEQHRLINEAARSRRQNARLTWSAARGLAMFSRLARRAGDLPAPSPAAEKFPAEGASGKQPQDSLTRH